MASKESAGVCLYQDHLEDAYKKFCKTVWPKSHGTVHEAPTSSSPAPDGNSEPHRAGPIFLFLKGDNVVGHVASNPIHVSFGSVVTPAHWIVGFMVLPEYRNGLVGPLLIKEVNRVLDYALSLHVEPPVLRILTGLKWVHKGVLPQYLRILNSKELVKNIQPDGIEAANARAGIRSLLIRSRFGRAIVEWVGTIGLAIGQKLWTSCAFMARPRCTGLSVEEEKGFDDSYTDLWNSVAAQFNAAIVRDRAYLQARFGRTISRYQLLVCRRDNRLLGYCILKMKRFSGDSRMGNMKVGSIVDCLFEPASPSILQSLIDHAFRWFSREGAHVVFCTASLTAVRRILLRNGFFRIPGNLNFAYHSRVQILTEEIPLEAWHLMRGDSDTDQNF